MEILIKLDERLYKNAKHHTLTYSEIDEICDAIANGTPLPKGHGAIWNAQTIIEADKGYEAKVITHGNCMMCGKELTEGLFFCKECEAKGRK